MPQPKAKNIDDENNDIKINVEDKSSIAEFTARPLPSEQELENFEDYIEDEAREGEIEDSLEEIYKEENGNMANVKKMIIKKKRGFFFWFFFSILALALLGGTGYAAYYFYMQSGVDSKAVELAIESKDKILAGEEFFYTINFKNLERVEIGNMDIRVSLPENFIFLDSQPAPSARQDTWHFSSLASHRSDSIKIKGKIIDKAGEKNIILAEMTYTPVNFSSEFKKIANFEQKIEDTGLELSIINPNSVLAGEENEILVKYKAEKESYINNFRLTVEPKEDASEEEKNNIEIIPLAEKKLAELKQSAVDSGVFQVDEIIEEERELELKIKFKDKITSQQSLIFKFEQMIENEGAKKHYLFYEEAIDLEIIKSDLNLNLIINGSQADQGIDFNEKLIYTIAYANKGEAKMQDVVIMAVLESDFLDWTSLEDDKEGRVSGNSISWSKEEIPALAALTRGDEGTINFSINVKTSEEINTEKDYQVKSYAQYSIGEDEEAEETEAREDMRSNTIINIINSDLNLTEQLRYFNNDNIAVGAGPQPPRVGETTSYKVYWTITNKLHDLDNLLIQAELPHYIKWENKLQATVGNLEYDEQTNKIIWQIGKLPTSVYRTDAEFSISITPEKSDANKIVVVLPGTIIQAIDTETKAAIHKENKAKTTRLDDDPIANDDGRVVE